MLFFVGLWTQADKAGNFPWRPAQLKLDILPFVEYDVSGTLEALRIPGFVLPYIGEDGKPYGHIPNFDVHQRFFGSEIKSPPRFPAFSVEKQTQEAPRKHFGSTLEVPRTVESGIRNQESGEKEITSEVSEGSDGSLSRPVKKPKPEFLKGSEPMEYAEFFQKFHADWAKGAKPPDGPKLQKWAGVFEAMNRIDEKPWSEIEAMLNAIDQEKPSKGSDFLWRNVILSPDTLRKRWNEGKLHKFIKEPAYAR